MNYSGEEIIQIAIGEEKDAIAFYRAAMDNSSSPGVKDLFHFLLHEEEKHLVELEKEILPVFQEAAFTWEDEDVIAAYLRSLGKSGVFMEGPKPKEFAKKNKDPMEVIEFAIGLERKAIIFYQKVEEASSESGKKALRRVIEEEGAHIHKLNELKAGLKKGE
ncbi:MAG: ferritin family protein [Nitrospinae bacterium]|nr:ferritin family protein [Nitrospinota bacterium]